MTILSTLWMLAEVTLAASVAKPSASHESIILDEPAWKPFVGQMGYPMRAMDENKQGTVYLACRIITAEGHTKCFIAHETVKGYGFGELALKYTEKQQIDMAASHAQMGFMIKHKVNFTIVTR